MITVVIPVGPDRIYKKYLQECLDSVKEQTIAPDEVILIDDMAGLWPGKWKTEGLNMRWYKNPWLCGVPHSFNFGVALAKNSLVIMLGSDDKLMPWAVEDALKCWGHHKDPLGYYFFDIEYSDTGEVQSAANNCAMVHKHLWRHTGGFPIESSLGPCDHIFLSMLLSNKCGNIHRIESEKPAYWYRRHKASVSHNVKIAGAVEFVEDYYNNHWSKPKWGRYE